MSSRSVNSKWSLDRLRGLIIGTAVTVGIIVFANVIVLAQLHQSVLREVQGNLLRQSLALSTVVERTFQSTDLVLASVAEKVRRAAAADGDLHQLTNLDYYVFLKEKMSGLPQIDALGILDADGKRLNLSREWPSPNTDLSYREYFQAIKENPTITSFVSRPVQASANGPWVVILARPVLAADGKLLGLVFASAPMKYFEELFHSTSLGEGYAATFMRQDGTLLARYPVAGEVGKRAPASVLTKLLASRSGVSRSISPFDHQARIVAGYRLVSYPLVVVATQNEEAAFAPWRAIAVTTGIIASIMIVLIIIAACLIARSWKQQERLNRARADVIESDKTRALAEAELDRQQDLAEQNMRFNAAVQNMSQGLCMFDKETRLVVCNELFAKMYRLPAELLKPRTLRSDIIEHLVRNGIFKGSHGDVAVQQQLSALPKLPADKKSSHINEHADGKLIRVTHQQMEGGGWVATHDDITEQRRAEQELAETKQFLDSIIENIPIAVVVKDANTRKYILGNRAFAAMLDLSQNDLLGKTVFDIYGSKTAELLDSDDDETLRSSNDVEYNECEVEMPTRGMRIHATNRIVIRNDQGDAKYLVAVIDDVTERKNSEQQIAYMAHHDALTGLANRAAVAQKIEDAAARHRRWGEPFTVLLMDLDRFKNVNDTLGHSAGDTLLQEAAMRLKTFLRETDVLARLGGDEFAIIQCGETDQREAAGTLADRIIELIAKPFNIDGNEVNIGTSIGIALAPAHGTNPDTVLKMADMALYAAKSAGRNGYRFFDPEMGNAANARLALENELRRAIQQDELELHYQPIIDTKTRRICAAEALVRWRHPTKGMIFPDKFIPLAEETGVIAQIGEWVLRTACSDAMIWPVNVRVAVNLSPAQFRQAKISEIVLSALAQSGLPPERLELEITETALIESAAECLPALRQFKNLGITIALDDFGTGYSSLGLIAMFPFDRIKIDKSFTQNLTKRTECAAIISATLTLAQLLDIATTAEGVETADQCRLLRLAGVTSMQGYLFKRPCPISEIDFDGIHDGSAIADAA